MLVRFEDLHLRLRHRARYDPAHCGREGKYTNVRGQNVWPCLWWDPSKMLANTARQERYPRGPSKVHFKQLTRMGTFLKAWMSPQHAEVPKVEKRMFREEGVGRVAMGTHDSVLRSRDIIYLAGFGRGVVMMSSRLLFSKFWDTTPQPHPERPRSWRCARA